MLSNVFHYLWFLFYLTLFLIWSFFKCHEIVSLFQLLSCWRFQKCDFHFLPWLYHPGLFSVGWKSEIVFFSFIFAFSSVLLNKKVVRPQALPTLAEPVRYNGMGQAPGFLWAWELERHVVGFYRTVQLHWGLLFSQGCVVVDLLLSACVLTQVFLRWCQVHIDVFVWLPLWVMAAQKN